MLGNNNQSIDRMHKLRVPLCVSKRTRVDRPWRPNSHRLIRPIKLPDRLQEKIK
ncbi:hypothetical protein Syun_006818 [Stephania yunnanensis]|uniref:Uncharacterized protein n=1 Tax=Stephania yunnanensis TaxID=152371 RepID=A0AAP0PXW9_9MAGN